MYFLSRFNSFFEIFFYEQWEIQSVFEIGDAFGRAKIDTQIPIQKIKVTFLKSLKLTLITKHKVNSLVSCTY